VVSRTLWGFRLRFGVIRASVPWADVDRLTQGMQDKRGPPQQLCAGTRPMSRSAASRWPQQLEPPGPGSGPPRAPGVLRGPRPQAARLGAEIDAYAPRGSKAAPGRGLSRLGRDRRVVPRHRAHEGRPVREVYEGFWDRGMPFLCTSGSAVEGAKSTDRVPNPCPITRANTGDVGDE